MGRFRSLLWYVSCWIPLLALGSSLAQEPKLETRSYDVGLVLQRHADSPGILAPQGRLVFQGRADSDADGPISFVGGFEELDVANSPWKGEMPAFGHSTPGEDWDSRHAGLDSLDIGDDSGTADSAISLQTLVEDLGDHLRALPRQKVRYWPTDLEVPLDRDVILHAFLPRGKEGLLLVGRVRSLTRSN